MLALLADRHSLIEIIEILDRDILDPTIFFLQELNDLVLVFTSLLKYRDYVILPENLDDFYHVLLSLKNKVPLHKDF